MDLVNVLLSLNENSIVKFIDSVLYFENKEIVQLYDPDDYMWNFQYNEPENCYRQWYLELIQADKAWDITKGDEDITIGIIDTWFDVTHPELQNAFVLTHDPYDLTEFNDDCLENHHGTSVAGFASADTDEGGAYASIGFNTRIYGYQANVTENIYMEKAHHASLVMGVDVLTSSAGPGHCNENYIVEYEIIINEILDNGTVIVMPAGNGVTGSHCGTLNDYGAIFPLHPKYDERIIMVTSTNKNDEHQYIRDGVDRTHSHFEEVDICAPGYELSTINRTMYDGGEEGCLEMGYPYGCGANATGTSFASPIVAGVCALIKSYNPCIAPATVQEIIRETADHVVDESNYSGLLGSGRINAYHALLETVNQSQTFIQNVTYNNSNNEQGLKLTIGEEVDVNQNFGEVEVFSNNCDFTAKYEIEVSSGFEIFSEEESVEFIIDENWNCDE